MNQSCPACACLVREQSCVCPHCGAKLCLSEGYLPSTARAAMMGLMLGASACFPVAKYGMPDSMSMTDEDGDGYYVEGGMNGEEADCDDSNPDINPGAVETPGDGVDSNCDGFDDT